MLNILSKFRKKLIKQRGVRKYLMYAFGEVLLIVIGVLIAIQVNNWNEVRKNDKLKKIYYRSLVADLHSDLHQLNMAKKRFAEELEEIRKYGTRLNSHTTTMDTLVQIVRAEFNPSVPPFVRYNLTTLETLKSTGDIGLVDTNILKELNVLQDLQNEQLYYQEATLRTHENLLENYLQSYTIYMGLIKSGALYELTWQEVNSADLILKFNALLTIKMAALESAIRYYEMIIKNTERLIEKIESV